MANIQIDKYLLAGQYMFYKKCMLYVYTFYIALIKYQVINISLNFVFIINNMRTILLWEITLMHIYVYICICYNCLTEIEVPVYFSR